MTDEQLAELVTSHEDLRATLRVARQRIEKLQFGRKFDDPVLVLIDRVQSEARRVAAVHKKGRRRVT